MFDNNIKTEPIPERLFELCKLVSQGETDYRIVKEKLEPQTLNKTASSYYGPIQAACEELNLIEKEGNIIRFIGDKKILKNLTSFRKYCNGVVYKDPSSYFYKVVQCYLESNEEWLKYKTLTDISIRNQVKNMSGISPVNEVLMLGTRFWVSFLGLGYIQEAGNSMYYLPNMYIALKDFIESSDLEKGVEYSLQEFLDKLYPVAKIAIEKTMESHNFNLAMSVALRLLHDNKEIVLRKASDADMKDRWFLYEDNSHIFVKEITHVTYKGVKK